MGGRRRLLRARCYVPDPEASVVLDVFAPEIAQHPHIFAQSPPEESSYQFE